MEDPSKFMIICDKMYFERLSKNNLNKKLFFIMNGFLKIYVNMLHFHLKVTFLNNNTEILWDHIFLENWHIVMNI